MGCGSLQGQIVHTLAWSGVESEPELDKTSTQYSLLLSGEDSCTEAWPGRGAIAPAR